MSDDAVTDEGLRALARGLRRSGHAPGNWSFGGGI